MDDVYNAAIARLDELKAEIKELNDFISLYRSTRHRLGLDATVREVRHTVVVGDRDAPPLFAGGGAPEPVKRTSVTDNPPPETVTQEVRVILSSSGYPLTRRELHRALREKGVIVRGADPVKTLGTMLWRSKAFVQASYKGHDGYWPKSLPLPNGEMPPQDG